MIREPKPEEIEQLVDIAIDHLIDSGIYEFDKPDRKEVRDSAKQSMISNDVKIYVAIKDREFIGYIVGKIYSQTWNKVLFGDINLFFVKPEHRRNHMTLGLWENLVGWFTDNNCRYYHCSANSWKSDYTGNLEWAEQAHNFFEKQGMNYMGKIYIKEIEKIYG